MPGHHARSIASTGRLPGWRNDWSAQREKGTDPQPSRVSFGPLGLQGTKRPPHANAIASATADDHV